MNSAGQQDFGAALRHAREQSGRSLRQMADATKLSVRAFEALERNRIDQLPGGIYRRAIVRSYASHVGLDAEQTLRAFLVIYPDEVPTAAQLVAEPEVKRSVLSGLFGFLSALVPVLAGVFYFTQAVGQPVSAPIDTAATPSEMLPLDDASPAAYEQSPVMMTLSISSSAYLEVLAGGRQVVAREVEPGETLRVELSTDVTLNGNDANAVQFSINGRAGRSLGTAGAPLAVRIDRDTYEDWLIRP